MKHQLNLNIIYSTATYAIMFGTIAATNSCLKDFEDPLARNDSIADFINL